jgi:hypothetical protein
MDAYARVSSHLRRLWETLGIERQPHDITPNYVADAVAAMPPATGRAGESK